MHHFFTHFTHSLTHSLTSLSQLTWGSRTVDATDDKTKKCITFHSLTHSLTSLHFSQLTWGSRTGDATDDDTERARLGPFRGLGTERARLGPFKILALIFCGILFKWKAKN